jgi:hypothetical protein
MATALTAAVILPLAVVLAPKLRPENLLTKAR